MIQVNGRTINSNLHVRRQWIGIYKGTIILFMLLWIGAQCVATGAKLTPVHATGVRVRIGHGIDVFFSCKIFHLTHHNIVHVTWQSYQRMCGKHKTRTSPFFSKRFTRSKMPEESWKKLFWAIQEKTCMCMRTTNAQTNLRICAVWSAPLLSTQISRLQTGRCSLVGWFEWRQGFSQRAHMITKHIGCKSVKIHTGIHSCAFSPDYTLVATKLFANRICLIWKQRVTVIAVHSTA